MHGDAPSGQALQSIYQVTQRHPFAWGLEQEGSLHCAQATGKAVLLGPHDPTGLKLVEVML